MEPHLQHTHGRHFADSDIHNAGAEEEHHGEKKSVMKKVKAKAKKLKDTLTKHGHDHHDHDDDDNDDDDDEMVEDPEVHGAPMYESSAIRSGLGPDAILGQPRGNLERPSVLAEDRYTTHSDIADTPVRPFAKWEEEETHGAPPPLSTGPYGSQPSTELGHHGHGQDVNRDHSGVKIGHSTAMEEDPHAPKDPSRLASDPSNYETKVTDPTNTGGKEAGLAQILHSFDKMGVNDEHESKSSNPDQHEQKLSSGSHDQFAPEPKTFHPDQPENLPRDTLSGNPSGRSGGYSEKISSATSAIADKAAAAKDAIAYKLGYSGQNKTEAETGVRLDDTTTAKSASATDYAHKIADSVTGTLAPVYDKVVDAGSSVMSKVQGTGAGSGTGSVPETEQPEKGREKGPDKGVSVKEYLVETFRPGDEDKALSEVITSAFQRGKEGEPEKKSGEESRPMGRVTESEEVQRRLGSDREEEERGSNNVSADKGVVDRLKGAVGSWLGGKGNAPPGSHGTSYVTDEGLTSSAGGDGGEGKVQESGK